MVTLPCSPPPAAAAAGGGTAQSCMVSPGPETGPPGPCQQHRSRRLSCSSLSYPLRHLEKKHLQQLATAHSPSALPSWRVLICILSAAKTQGQSGAMLKKQTHIVLGYTGSSPGESEAPGHCRDAEPKMHQASVCPASLHLSAVRGTGTARGIRLCLCLKWCQVWVSNGIRVALQHFLPSEVPQCLIRGTLQSCIAVLWLWETPNSGCRAFRGVL